MTDNLSLMEKFSDPVLIEELSLSDKMFGGLLTTLMGMGITIGVLSLIWLLIVVMQKCILYFDKQKESKEKQGSAKSDGEISGEIAAVIAAATLAYERDKAGFQTRKVGEVCHAAQNVSTPVFPVQKRNYELDITEKTVTNPGKRSIRRIYYGNCKRNEQKIQSAFMVGAREAESVDHFQGRRNLFLGR